MKNFMFPFSIIAIPLLFMVSCGQNTSPSIQNGNTIGIDGNNDDTVQSHLPKKIVLDQTSNVQQVYNWVGIGYKSNAKELKASCVEDGIWSADVGQRNSYSAYEAVEDKQHIFEKMDLDAKVSIDLIIATGSAKGTYSKSKEINNYNLYLMLTVESNLGTLSLLQPKLTQEAELLLKTEGQEKFSERCGDFFVSSVTLGGKYHAIMRFEASSAQVKKRLKAHVEAKIGVGIFSAKISKDIDKIFSQWDKMADIHYSVIQSPLILSDIGNFQERDFTAPTNDAGAYDKSKGVAQFFLVAERYITTLKDLCSFTLEDDDTYSYPQQCVQSVALQDYFTLTDLPKNPDFAALRRKSNMIKQNGATFLNTLNSIESDAWFYSQNAYLFTDSSANTVQEVNAIYDAVQAKAKEVESDLSLCAQSFRNAEDARCQQYVDNTVEYNTLQQQIIDWQKSVPDSKEFASTTLPQSCDDLAQHLTLEFGTTYKLFYLGASDLPYSVYCRQDLQNTEHFIEYIRLSDSDGYFAANYKEVLPAAVAQQPLGTVSRINNKGETQYATWRYLRLNPTTMTIDLTDTIFRDNYGNVSSNIFGILDDPQGLRPASALVCAKNDSQTHFAFASVSLVNTDLIFDTLSLNDILWKTQSNEGSGIATVKQVIDENDTQQRLMVLLQATKERCIYSQPQFLRVLPASYITPRN